MQKIRYFYRLIFDVFLSAPKNAVSAAALISKGCSGTYRYLQYLQYLPIFENGLYSSADAGLRETPKWQFLEPRVAISRT